MFEALFPLTRDGVFPVEAALKLADAQNMDTRFTAVFIALIGDVVSHLYLKDQSEHE